MTSTIAIRTPARTSTPRIGVAVVAVVAVALLAVVGGWLAILALAGSDGHAQAPRAAAIGDQIATSFGSLTIQRSDTLAGLTSQDLGGVTHGINDLVLSDSAQVEVSFLLVSTSSAEARVEPGQFRLVVSGTTDPLAPTGSTMRPLTLAPGARVAASVTFVVPRSGAQMSVRYTDPGSGAEISVPVGSLDHAPPAVGDPHAHTP
jgi:hypothetical protein